MFQDVCAPQSASLEKFFDLSPKQQFKCLFQKGQLFVEQIVS